MALYWKGAEMQAVSFLNVAKCFWFVFGLYWLMSARKLKATKKREPWPEMLGHRLPLIVAYTLLFSSGIPYGWLGKQFANNAGAIGATGLALTAAGVALAIWARWHLGENWSASVTLKAEHELVRSGPYRYVRHPIYTGILMAMAGTALVLGEVRGFLALGIALISFYAKARKEERWLAKEFGDGFEAHIRQTGMFLPRLP